MINKKDKAVLRKWIEKDKVFIPIEIIIILGKVVLNE